MAAEWEKFIFGDPEQRKDPRVPLKGVKNLNTLISEDIEKNGARSVVDEMIIILNEDISIIDAWGVEDGFSMAEIESFTVHVETKYKCDVLVHVAEALDVKIFFDLEAKLEELIKQLEKMKESL